MEMEVFGRKTGGGHQEKSVVDVGFNGLIMVPQDQSDGLVQFEILHMMDEPNMRNFIVSSADNFIFAQEEFSRSYPNPVLQSSLTDLSQKYRGILLEFSKFSQANGNIESAELYSKLDFVWNFCEIMFISSHPDLPAIPYLLEWIQGNFEQSPKLFNEVFDSQELDEETINKIWNQVFVHVCHGRTEDAAKILSLLNPSHKGFLEEQINFMVELLTKKPAYKPHGSVNEFQSAWQNWRTECSNRILKKTFFGNRNLEIICQILCGEDSGFLEVQGYIHTWFEYFVMLINYKYPTTKPTCMKAIAKMALEYFSKNDLAPYEQMLFDAMDFDVIRVIRSMLDYWNHPWFALHFSDLIFCGGVAPQILESKIDFNLVQSLRNELLLNYGSMLMHHPSMWMVGVKYLEAITDEVGGNAIRTFIEKRNPKSDWEAQKLLHICLEYQFPDIAQGVCKKVARQKLLNDDKQRALLWSIKANDGALTTYIVDQILFGGDCRIDSSLLDSLKKTIPCADRLAFLNGYCDLRKLMVDKNYKEAMSLLSQLIKDDLIPQKIAEKVIQSIEEMTKNSNEIFGKEETTNAMKFLHSNVSSSTYAGFQPLSNILVSNRSKGILNAFKNLKKY